MTDTNINSLADRYQVLRQIPGQCCGGTSYDERVDNPTGEEYQVMKSLGEQLGIPNTPASHIIRLYG
ncbi:hypothetical protein BDB01DRAFT_852295 [Pilobolus umbonatus]|nr:hypothetical protein BDB01DRAFT_852295 [Pilobolus umbonatus]